MLKNATAEVYNSVDKLKMIARFPRETAEPHDSNRDFPEGSTSKTTLLSQVSLNLKTRSDLMFCFLGNSLTHSLLLTYQSHR